jgi:hypothetical protein
MEVIASAASPTVSIEEGTRWLPERFWTLWSRHLLLAGNGIPIPRAKRCAPVWNNMPQNAFL